MEQWNIERLGPRTRHFVESDDVSTVHLPDCLLYYDQHANTYADDFFKVRPPLQTKNRWVRLFLQSHE